MTEPVLAGKSWYPHATIQCNTTMLVELTGARFDSAKWDTSFEREATREKVLRNVSNNGVLKEVSGNCCRTLAVK